MEIGYLLWRELKKSGNYFDRFVNVKDSVTQNLLFWKTLSLRFNAFPLEIGHLFWNEFKKSVICFDRFVNVKDIVTQNLLFWKTLSLRFNAFPMGIGHLFWHEFKKIGHLFWQEILKSVIFFSPLLDLKGIVTQILLFWKTLSLRFCKSERCCLSDSMLFLRK
jgi:hypothetical protein